MSIFLSFWAKLGNETWPDKYHPVICHLIDVAAVTWNLWDAVFRPRFRTWFANRLGLEDKACGRWLAFWSGAHDIGKVAACFQDRNDDRTKALRTRLQAEGLSLQGPDRPHGTIGAAVLAELLVHPGGWPALSESLACRVAVAVGGHHGLFPPDWHVVRDLLNTANGRGWQSMRQQILARLAHLLDVQGRVPEQFDPSDQSLLMVLAGLTSVADWIGSNQTFFPAVGNPEVAAGRFDIEDYFGRALGHARMALQQLGWLDRGHPSALRTFQEAFAGIVTQEPRPLQRAVEEIARGLVEPTLIVIEAPMGEGKTEAAWYVADTWEQRGSQGTYVALPTMATSNQMFDRVGQFLKANPGKKNLMLLHGKAALNEQFEKLKYVARVYDDETRPGAVVAEQWFADNKKHGLLAPYGVGTIDQALLAVLQTKHVFVRLFGLAGKCVILDEVHAYDAYMTTLMERLLQWLAALGCPVVLLSATLPREKRLKLLQAYGGDAMTEPEDRTYPRVSSAAVGGQSVVQHVDADPARAQTIELGWVDKTGLAKQLRESLASGGCAAVIRNSVGLAQNTYLDLRDALKDDGITVELFHARFPFGRRMEIEKAVLKRFGKDGGPAERDKQVLVATQVVEQSLDLDFDLMISDIAPVDLVLQRAGRLWRHRRTQRLGRAAQGQDHAPLWLIEPPTGDGEVPDFGVSGFVYSRYVLFRSLLALRSDAAGKRETVRLPTEIDALIEQVYADSPAPDALSPAEQAFWITSHADHQDTIETEKGEAESRQIKKPRFRGALARVVQEPREEDNPDLHPAHQALTRLTRPTVPLICLDRDDNGSYRLPHDNTPVHTLEIRKMSQGGFEDVGRLMLGEVVIAHRGVINQVRQAPLTPPAWADVGLLCRHHLIAFSRGKASLGTYELALDTFLGLTITRAGGLGADE